VTDTAQIRLELENRKAALAELHSALIEAERRSSDVEQRIEHIEHAHAVELAARGEVLHRLEARIAQLEHELRVAVHERNTFEWERDQARAERDAARERLDAIVHSRSYRWAQAVRRPLPGRAERASP
jgi:chromosome segregation ATPase